MSSRTAIQWLVIVIVQDQDLEQAMCVAEALGAPVVNLASTGGFLGQRNATLLIGLPAGPEERLIDELHQTCRQRIEYMTMPVEGVPLPIPAPIPINVGGATIFALPVERFEEM